jgi:hypothetical protein
VLAAVAAAYTEVINKFNGQGLKWTQLIF